jgi:sRNA-binding protein
MGLEQLAAIRGLLFKQAPEETASTKPARPAAAKGDGTRGEKRDDKRGGNRNGKREGQRAPQQAGQQQAGQRQAPREKRDTDVDPVLIAISRLQRQFPKAFPKKPAAKVPLKLGVLEDLQQHAKALQLTAEEIKVAVKTWCDGRRYWDSMVEAAPRVDLNGEPAGAVTANEAQHAKRMASRRHAKGAAARGKGNANKAKPQADGAPATDAAQDVAATPASADTAAPAADDHVKTSAAAPAQVATEASVAQAPEQTPDQAPADTQAKD